MYIYNKQSEDIKLASFEGYVFTIPSGISWIWDKAGEHLLKEIYRVETPASARKTTDGRSIDKYGFDNGHGVPPLFEAKQEDWVGNGKKLSQVKRYKINSKLVPRKKLITIAQQRGVSNARVLEYLSDSEIDVSMIAEDINNLPVPESVRYPSDFESDK